MEQPTASDTECTCGAKLERSGEIIYGNCFQIYSRCPECKETFIFTGYAHNEATASYKDDE